MIRSSKSSIKFANAGRRSALLCLLDEYENLLKESTRRLWRMEKIPSLMPKAFTDALSEVSPNSSARLLQCAAKQASGIVRGAKAKQEKRAFMEAKLRKEGNTKQADKLRKILEESKVGEPDIGFAEAELDARFVSIDWISDTGFVWINLSSLGGKRKLSLPVKRTKHINEMLKVGVPLKGIRLSKKDVTFQFELRPVDSVRIGETLGVDVGIKKMFIASDGQTAKAGTHGHSIETVMKKLSVKKKGSKAFARAQAHRKNIIGEAVNKHLSLDGVKELRLEKLISIRKGRQTNRLMTSWSYPAILGKLKDKAARLGVRVVEVSPTYTSQRCSCCGFVHKGNRKLELFKCRSCGYTADADLNGAINISLPLSALPSGVRESKLNLKGFFWKLQYEKMEPSAPFDIVRT